MSSFFNGSLLDEYALSKSRFEGVVGLGASKAEVCRMFCLGLLQWAGEDTYGLDVIEYCSGETGKHVLKLLDDWCRENYFGMPFASVYELIQTTTVKKFEDAMLELGVRGNPSAIAIMNEVIRKKENNGIVQVNFVNSLPPETEADKENDDDD